MLYVFAAVSAASAVLCLLGMLFSSATLLGKVLLGLIFCGAIGGLIASVEKIVSLRRSERDDTPEPEFEAPVTIPQAPFAGNAFANDYRANATVATATTTPSAPPAAQENPWKFVPEYRPIPASAPPFPAPIQNPAPHSTPSHYVPPQQTVVSPTSPDNGIGAALGGLALGTLLGAHLGTGAATAQAAAADEERRRRNNQTVTSPSTSEPAYVPPAALPPITAGEAEAQAAGVALAPMTADEVEPTIETENEPAGGVALAPITAEEAEGQTPAEPQADLPEEHEPVQFRTLEEPQDEQPGVALEPITADEAEHAAPAYAEPEPYRSPVPEPTRYEPEPEPEPRYSAPSYAAPEPEPRYEAPSYTRDPDPEPDTSWSDTASSTWDSGSSWTD